jgi:DNA-binding NarL/FixJ family response regulator
VTKAPNKASRILIVDDQPVVLAGLTQIINRQEGLVCCGEAKNVASAREAFRECKPDLVTVDLGLPDGSGMELIEEFTKMEPSFPVLVISQYDESLYAERVLKAGAKGFVMKDSGSKEIVEALRSLLGGGLYVSRRVTALALEQLAGKKAKNSDQALDVLTNRELQVLQLLGSGLGSRAVANKLKLSIKTVETHRENIKQKLGIRDAAGLIHYATKWVAGRDGRSRGGKGKI